MARSGERTIDIHGTAGLMSLRESWHCGGHGTAGRDGQRRRPQTAGSVASAGSDGSSSLAPSALRL